MTKQERETLHAKDIEVAVLTAQNQADYISLTDIARYKQPDNAGLVIHSWMRNRNTVEFIGLWEQLNNPDFNSIEFDRIRMETGLNSFILTPKRWVQSTGAIGITTKQGRYAATFAHSDIAFEFASWISPEFKLYLIKDYQRLKSDEVHLQRIEWSARRLVSKANYRLHTDAVQKYLVLPQLTPQQVKYVYANEADLINVALFGQTALEWRNAHPAAKGNMRDEADVTQLVILSNLESINAELIKQELSQGERLRRLRKIAVYQLGILEKNASIKRLSEIDAPQGKLNLKSDPDDTERLK